MTCLIWDLCVVGSPWVAFVLLVLSVCKLITLFVALWDNSSDDEGVSLFGSIYNATFLAVGFSLNQGVLQEGISFLISIHESSVGRSALFYLYSLGWRWWWCSRWLCWWLVGCCPSSIDSSWNLVRFQRLNCILILIISLPNCASTGSFDGDPRPSDLSIIRHDLCVCPHVTFLADRVPLLLVIESGKERERVEGNKVLCYSRG